MQDNSQEEQTRQVLPESPREEVITDSSAIDFDFYNNNVWNLPFDNEQSTSEKTSVHGMNTTSSIPSQSDPSRQEESVQNLPRSSQEAATLPDISDLDFSILLDTPFQNDQASKQMNPIHRITEATPIPSQTGSNCQVAMLLPAQGPSLIEQANFSVAAGSSSNSTTANLQSYTVSNNVLKDITTKEQFKQLLINLGYEPKHYQSVAAWGRPPLLQAYPPGDYNYFEELHHRLLSQGFTRENIVNLACRSKGRERLQELAKTGFEPQNKLIGSEEFQSFLREKRLEFNAEQLVKVVAVSSPQTYTSLTALYKHTEALIDKGFTLDQIINMLSVTSSYGSSNLSSALKYFDDFKKLNFDDDEKNNPELIIAKLAKILSYPRGTERLKFFIHTYDALRKCVSDATVMQAISKEKGKAALESLCTEYNINPEVPSASIQTGEDSRNLAIGSSQRDHLVEGQEVITNRGQFEQLLIKLGYPKSLYNFPIGTKTSTMLTAYPSHGYSGFAKLHHQLIARGFSHEDIATLASRDKGKQRLQLLLKTGYDTKSKLVGCDDFKSFFQARRLEIRKDQLIQVMSKSHPEASTYIDAFYEHAQALIEKGFTLEQVLHMLAAIHTGHINLASALESFDDFRELNLSGDNNEQSLTSDLAKVLHYKKAGNTLKLLLQTHSELKKYCSYEEIMGTVAHKEGMSRLEALCAKHDIDTEQSAVQRRGNEKQGTEKNVAHRSSTSNQAPNIPVSSTAQSPSTSPANNSPGFLPFPSNSPELPGLLGLSPELPNANQMNINSAVNAEATIPASEQHVRHNLEDAPAYKKCLDSQGNIISQLKYFTKEQLLAVAGQEDGEKRIDLLIYVAWQFVSKKFPPTEIIKLAMHKNYAQTLRVSRQDYTAELVESRLKAVDNLGNQELSRQQNNIAFHAALMPSSTRPESDFERARLLSLQDSAPELPQMNNVPMPLSTNQPGSNAVEGALAASAKDTTQSQLLSIDERTSAVTTCDRVVAEMRPEANTVANSLALYTSVGLEGGLFSRAEERYDTQGNYPTNSFSDLTLNSEPTVAPAEFNAESFFNQALSSHAAAAQELAFEPSQHQLMAAGQLFPLEAMFPMQTVATTTVVNQMPQQTESNLTHNSQVIAKITNSSPQSDPNWSEGEGDSDSDSYEYADKSDCRIGENDSDASRAPTAARIKNRQAKRSREESQDQTSSLKSDHEQLLISLGYTEQDYLVGLGRNKCSLLDVLYQPEFSNFKKLHIALSGKGFTCTEIAQIATLANGEYRLRCIIESGFDDRTGLLGPEGSSFRKALHERGLRFSKDKIIEIVMKQRNGNRHKENNLAGVINYGCALIIEGVSAQQIVQIAAKQGGTHNLKAASEKFAQLQALTYLKEESANKAKIIERMISIVGHRDGHERLNKFIQIYDSLRAKGYPDKDIMAAFDKDKFNLEQELKWLDSKYGQGSKSATRFSSKKNSQVGSKKRNAKSLSSGDSFIADDNSKSDRRSEYVSPNKNNKRKALAPAERREVTTLPAEKTSLSKPGVEGVTNVFTTQNSVSPLPVVTSAVTVSPVSEFENLLKKLGYSESQYKKPLGPANQCFLEAFPKEEYGAFQQLHDQLLSKGVARDEIVHLGASSEGITRLKAIVFVENLFANHISKSSQPENVLTTSSKGTTAVVMAALNSSKATSNGLVQPVSPVANPNIIEEKQDKLETAKENIKPVITSQDFKNLLNYLGYTEQLFKGLKTPEGNLIPPSIIEAYPASGYEKFESWHHALIKQGFKHEDIAKIASDNQGDKKLEKVGTLYNGKTGLIGHPESKIYIYMNTQKLKLRIDQVVDLLGQPGGHNNLDGIIAYIVPLTTKGFNLDDLVEIASHTNGHKNLKAANDYFEAVKKLNMPIDKTDSAQIIARIKTVVAHDSGFKFLKQFVNLYNLLRASQCTDEEIMNGSRDLEALCIKYRIEMGVAAGETGSRGDKFASMSDQVIGEKRATKRKVLPIPFEELNAEIPSATSKKSSTSNMMQKLNAGKHHVDFNTNTETASSSSVSKNLVTNKSTVNAGVVRAPFVSLDADGMSSVNSSQLHKK